MIPFDGANMTATRSPFLRTFGACLVLAAAVAWTPPAVASLLTDTVTVKMDIDIALGLQTDDVVVGAGAEIQANDSTNIGSTNLIQDEYIDLTDGSLIYRVAGGVDVGNPDFTSPGFGSFAYLLFEGLDFVGDPSRFITGVTVALADVDLPGAAVTTPDGHSIRVALADVLVANPTGSTAPILGTITLSPIWSDPGTVPEPSALALLATAIAGLAGVARRTRRARQ